MIDPQKIAMGVKILTALIADEPAIEKLIVAGEALIAAEKVPGSFAERQKVSEPFQEALAAFADTVLAQIRDITGHPPAA